MGRDIAVILLAAGASIAIVLVALAIFHSVRVGHKGWSFHFGFLRDNDNGDSPIDPDGPA